MVPSFLELDGHEGYAQKYEGDGLIAFFLAVNEYMTATYIVADCAIVMKLLIDEVLNSLLRARNYRALRYRIGIDSGETQIVSLGADNIKSTPDVPNLLGYTANLAAKICRACRPDQVLMGETVYRSLHVTRKKHFKEERLPVQKWNFLDATTNKIYPLFALSTTRALGSLTEKDLARTG